MRSSTSTVKTRTIAMNKRHTIMRHILLTAFAMMLLVSQSYGQGHSTEISAPYGSEFTINGLIIGGPAEYGEEDLIAAFGQPDAVEYDEFGYTYVYNRDMTKKPDGYVQRSNHSAEITLPRIPGPILSVYISDRGFVINGHIEVGDPISKVYDLGGKFKTHDYGDGDGGWLRTRFQSVPCGPVLSGFRSG